MAERQRCTERWCLVVVAGALGSAVVAAALGITASKHGEAVPATPYLTVSYACKEGARLAIKGFEYVDDTYAQGRAGDATIDVVCLNGIGQQSPPTQQWGNRHPGAFALKVPIAPGYATRFQQTSDYMYVNGAALHLTQPGVKIERT